MTAVHLTSASYLKSSISGHRIHSHPLPITSHPILQQWTRYPTTKYSMSSHCSSLVPPLGSLYHQHLLASHHPDPPLVLLSATKTCFTTLTIHDLRRRTRSAPRLESPPLVTMPRRHVQLSRHTYCTSASTSHCDTSPLFMVHNCPYAFPLAMCSSRGVHAMYFTHQERKSADTLEPRFLVYMRFGSLVCTTSCAHSPSRVGF